MEVNMEFRQVPVVQYEEASGSWFLVMFVGIATEIDGERVIDVGGDILMEGGGVESLARAVAVAIELIRLHIDEDAVGDTVHVVDGSVESFDEQFAGAFDLKTGRADLADLGNLPVRHIQDDKG